RRAIEDLIAHPDRIHEIDKRIGTLIRMSGTAEALNLKAPFEELMGVVKKNVQSEKVLRLVFGDFIAAFQDAARAGMKKDLAGFRSGLERSRKALAGFEDRLKAEMESLP